MAGSKGPRTKVDGTKKRKRDTIDSDTKSKRHRQQTKVNGSNTQTLQRLKQENQGNDGAAGELSSFTPQEVIRPSDDGEAGWRISKPMGGRMLDIDPILTEDEQCLILTYNTSLQIYNANDSLLVRRIPISTLDTSAPKGSTPAHIVATRLSKSNPHLAWVACSDGQIYRVDWTQGETPDPTFQTSSRTAKALAVVPAAYAEDKEVLLVAESDSSNLMEVVAYQPVNGSQPKSNSLLTLKKSGSGLQLLETSEDGQVIAGAHQDSLFLGTLSVGAESLDQLQYEIFSFDCPDIITCIDLRLYARTGNRRSQVAADKVVDIIVGGARGSIYVYHDALTRVKAAGKSQLVKDGIQVQKYHWHRKAVHAVKWSRDGHYFISGGSESVLVVWQVDTSKKDFLPHLSGSVENIVVSPSGSSYVLHLDDNSAMILSTAEMKPTAYIAGIQSAAIDVAESKDMLVQRVWNVSQKVRRPIPAAIRPSEPSKLHVCVGNGRQATLSGYMSAPLLQTFDLQSFTSVSKQALARTQPTDVNLSSKGHPIDEPMVTNISFSGDGRWLASIDEWQPAPKDLENLSADLRAQFMRERHEVYLKFWEVGDGAEEPIELVSRINAPHSTSWPESVLDLASDPSSSCFATIGSDGIVRLWRPRPRQQNGVAVKDASGRDAVSWGCTQVIGVGDGTDFESATDAAEPTQPIVVQGKIAFSEDGSTLFAGFGGVDSGVIYVIDVASGHIVKTLEGLWEGELRSVQALSSFVIVLSNDLSVYDVVGDELQYGIVVPKIYGVTELHQLAVDHTSGHFAVTLPIGGVSSIGVFDPQDPEPLLVRSTPHRIVSLVSAPGTSGFIALDDSAQVWVIAEGSDPSSLATVQPLEDLQLEGPSEALDADESTGEILAQDEMEVESEDEMGDAKDADEDVEMDDDDDDDADEAYGSVIPQQFLTEIFDAAPAFAAPSIEDMFYKVTGLLATKPLAGQQ